MITVQSPNLPYKSTPTNRPSNHFYPPESTKSISYTQDLPATQLLTSQQFNGPHIPENDPELQAFILKSMNPALEAGTAPLDASQDPIATPDNGNPLASQERVGNVIELELDTSPVVAFKTLATQQTSHDQKMEKNLMHVERLLTQVEVDAIPAEHNYTPSQLLPFALPTVQFLHEQPGDEKDHNELYCHEELRKAPRYKLSKTTEAAPKTPKASRKRKTSANLDLEFEAGNRIIQDICWGLQEKAKSPKVTPNKSPLNKISPNKSSPIFTALPIKVSKDRPSVPIDDEGLAIDTNRKNTDGGFEEIDAATRPRMTTSLVQGLVERERGGALENIQRPPREFAGPIVASEMAIVVADSPSKAPNLQIGEDVGEFTQRLGPAKRKACVHCGKTMTTVWRKGPKGPESLCAGCGEHYSLKKTLPVLTAKSSARASGTVVQAVTAGVSASTATTSKSLNTRIGTGTLEKKVFKPEDEDESESMSVSEDDIMDEEYEEENLSCEVISSSRGVFPEVELYERKRRGRRPQSGVRQTSPLTRRGTCAPLEFPSSEMQGGRITPIGPIPTVNYHRGQKVWATWEDKNFYPAVVEQCDGELIDLVYDDDSRASIVRELVRDFELAIGDNVYAQTSTSGKTSSKAQIVYLMPDGKSFQVKFLASKKKRRVTKTLVFLSPDMVLEKDRKILGSSALGRKPNSKCLGSAGDLKGKGRAHLMVGKSSRRGHMDKYDRTSPPAQSNEGTDAKFISIEITDYYKIETFGPIPESAIFKGVGFVITWSNGSMGSTGDGEDCEKEELEAGSYPLDKTYIEKQIRAGGGVIIEELLEFFNCRQRIRTEPSLIFVIASKSVRTKKFMLGLALGAILLKFRKVIELI